MANKTGWLLVDYDGTGLLCIEKDDSMRKFKTDAEAATAFMKATGKNLSSLASLAGIYAIDTPRNREILKNATYGVYVVRKDGAVCYVRRLTRGGGVNTTAEYDFSQMKKLKWNEVAVYKKEVEDRLAYAGMKSPDYKAFSCILYTNN